MKHLLRTRHVLSLCALIAAGGCTVEEDLIPDIDGGPRVDAAGSDAGPSTCEAGETDCGGTCTRVAVDSMNCGSCGNVCPSGFSCAVGRCDCAEPMKSCDGLCIDPSSDPMNCGSCGNECASDESCLAGECVTDCDAPLERCENTDDDGSSVYVCANVQTDAMNCGGCNTVCAGGASCMGGSCACAGEQISCSGMCTDIETDANNCGACLNSCGADGVCEGGTCTSCGGGLTACGTPRRCVDTTSSLLHCGACDNTCGSGESCNAGTCECLPGRVDCDGTCSHLDTDPRNCGGCGIDCGRGTCSAGVCSCAADATMCGAACAVLSEDPENCGDCGVACASDQACISSACVTINATCTAAYSVTADVMIPGEETIYGTTAPTGDGCGFGSGDQALWYAVTIPAGQEVAVTTNSSDDLVLFEQAACGDTACARSSDFPESLTLTNAGTTDITRIVGVRAYSSSTDATYDIAFSYSTPVFAPNAACTTATAITADTSITGEDTNTGGARPGGSDCGFGTGAKALYYSVTIPAGQQVAVDTTSSGDLVLFEQAACGDTDCIRATDFPESLTLLNTGTSDITRIVGVRSYSSSSSATYDIDFTYSTPVVAANASCSTATAITADTTITGEDTEEGGPRPTGSSCGSGASDKALYYAVTIPAGQQVAATTSRTSSVDLVLFELAACGDANCVRSTDSPESLTFTNTGASTVTAILGVRGYSAAGGTFPGGLFDITFTYTTP